MIAVIDRGTAAGEEEAIISTTIVGAGIQGGAPGEPSPAMARLAELRALLAIPGFLRLSTGNGLAQSGLRLQNIAVAWLVLELTGSRLMLGIVIGAPALGVIVASLAGGVLADSRHARRSLRWARLLLASGAFTTGLLVAGGQVHLAALMLLALLAACATAVDMPVARTLTFEVVGKQRVLSGIAMGSLTSNLASAAGPLAVGALMAHFGVDFALYAIAAAYVLASALVPATSAAMAPARDLSPWQEVRAGFAYLREAPCVAWLVSLFFLVPLAGVFFAMVPVYAHEVLDVGPGGLGILMASWGLGTVAGSSYLVVNGHMRGRGVKLTVFGVLFGAGMALFAVAGSLLACAAVAFAMGLVAMLWQNTLSAMVQTAAAPEMKGRAMSIGTMGNQLMTLGWLVAGVSSTLAGPVTTVAAAGAAFAGLSLLVFARSRDVRTID